MSALPTVSGRWWRRCLPGFSYVEWTLPAALRPNAAITAVVADRTVTFTFVGGGLVHLHGYCWAEAWPDGPHSFTGVLNKLSGDETIGGDSRVTVDGHSNAGGY